MSAGPLVVTYPLTGRSREIVAEELDGTAEAIYLVDLAPADRAHALRRAGAVLSHDTSKELRSDEIPLIRNARLLQFTASPLESRLPAACPRNGCGWRSAHSCCLPRCCWCCGGDRSRVWFRGMRWPRHSPRNEELGRVVLSVQNSDDGHDKTFISSDDGGCFAGMFGCAIIC